MRNLKYIVVSALSIFNIIFIPSFDVWGGLFPSHPDANFFEIIETIFTDSDAFYYWSVVIVVSVLIPAIAMLIGAILDNKTVFLISSLVGIILWLRFIIAYINQNELSDLFDFDSGSIAIGTWIAIVLFVISFVMAITSKESKQTQSQPYVNNANSYYNVANKSVETDNKLNQVIIQYGLYCPNCGAEQEKPSKFCGNCGFEFTKK